MDVADATNATNATNAAARDRVRAGVLAEIAAVAPEADLARLSGSRPLRRQVELDSMDWLHVIVGWHARFGVEIPEADYAQLGSVDAVVDYLMTRQAQRPVAAP